MKEGEHQKVVFDHVEKLRRQIRWARITAGLVGGILLLTGLWSWALEFGLVGSPAKGDQAYRGLGTLLVIGASAIFTLFNVERSRKKVTLFDGAREVDSFRRGNESTPQNQAIQRSPSGRR